MELHSPYLQAIQRIPGTVPSEKYKALNSIAKRIAASTTAHGDSVAISQVDDVPEPLLPLVQLEVADILRQYSGVVEALKSEDSSLIDRALTMRWFFRGDNKEIISVEYFEKNLLPYISLDTRFQLIKRLSMNLRSSGKTEVAEKFYTFFATKYSKQQAEPLLVACGESFIYDTVTVNRIILSCRTVKILFLRYPELVIRYLKLSKPNEEKWHRGKFRIGIDEYSDFLPMLIKNHSSTFVELLEMHYSHFGIELSNKATERFFKSNVQALLDKPKFYSRLIPLEVIAEKLTKSQYKCIFPKWFPKQCQEFNYEAVSEYLEFYPVPERLSLVVDTYKEVYSANFLDNTDAIGVEFLCMLPAEERARQARIKLEEQPDWRDNRDNWRDNRWWWQEHRENVEKAWRCYLPIEESIPSIKTEISKSSEPDDRSSLLKQMFYSCKVNDDKDALLEALRYFITRHKNERTYLIFEVLDNLTNFFDLSTVGKDHWNVLNDLIQFLHVKNELGESRTISEKILVAGIHFNLIHDLPIEDKIAIILEMNMKRYHQSWSLLEKYPEYNRRCFETFLSMIPEKYPKDDEKLKDQRLNVIDEIMKSMSDFNIRNAKANSKIEKLTIKSYPWLLETVKNIVEMKGDEDFKWKSSSVISILKILDKDLYDEWIVIEEETVVSVETVEALTRLAKDPKNILDNWEEYVNKARRYASSDSYARRFIRATRWHQEIPIKFADRCIKDVADNQDEYSIYVLGILMRGDEFASLVEPLLPKDSKIDTTDEKAESTYRFTSYIPKAMSVANPPVPLRLVLSFCDGDYLNVGLNTWNSICRHVSVAKIEPFTKTLVDRRVSVKKHGVRLYCLVASLDDIRNFLTELWKTEKHRSIRAVVFDKIYSLFVSEPNTDTWMIMKNCLVDLKVDDDDVLEKLMKFDVIPNQYIADYVKQLLQTFEKLEENGFSTKRTVSYVSRILRNVYGEITNIMPEDFCEELLRKYFCNPSLDIDISSAGNDYAINGYLHSAEEKLESRLAVLCSIFEDKLKRHWNVPHPKKSTFFPINYLAHNFMTSWMILRGDVQIMKSILKSFLAVLRPECDFEAYALLTSGIALEGVTEPSEIVAKIVETLPILVEALSPEIVVHLTSIVQEWIYILVESDKRDNFMHDLMDSLCNIGTDHACMLATSFLSLSKERPFKDRRSKIIAILRESKNPIVASLIYRHANANKISD